MYTRQFARLIAGTTLILLLLINGGYAAEIVVNTDDTWSDATPFETDDTAIVNNGAVLTVDGDTTAKKLSSLTLGKTTVSPVGDGTGTLTLTATGKIDVDAFILGDENDGIFNMASGGTFSADAITFNRGTITNDGLLTWLSASITWNNASAIVFDGSDTGSILIGNNASGQLLELQGGILTTTGSLDASDFTLTGGTLQVAGALTFNQQLTSGGSTIELLENSTWTADQDQSAGTIVVSGGTLTLGMAQDFQTGGGSLSMSSGLVDLNGYDLNLGDAGASVITGGSFASTEGNTVSWNSGTVKGSVYTFFNEAYYTDNVNVAISGDGVLEVYDDDNGGYTVAYDFTLSDTATIIGGDEMMFYVQAAATIESTSGINTTNIYFMGRNDKSTLIDSGATFEGFIQIDNGVFNEVKNGIFNGEIGISNPGDDGTGTVDVPVGVGITEISGGTFNEIVAFGLYVREDIEVDDENKAIVSGGTFNGSDENGALEIDGPGASLISGGTFNRVVTVTGGGIRTITGGTFNDTLSVEGTGTGIISGGTYNGTIEVSGSGTTSLSGGTIDSIEMLAAGTGTVNVTSNVSVIGADGVILEGGTLSLASGQSLTLTTGVLLMQATSGTGGTLTGEGTLVGDLNLTAGILAGNVTINGNVTQTGGTIAPGNSIGTTTITGDLSLGDATIEASNDGTSDKIVVGGQTTLTSTGTLTLTPLSPSDVFHLGDQFTVIESAGGIVNSAGYTLNSAIAGFELVGTIDGNDYVITLGRAIHSFPAGAHNATHTVDYLYDLYDAGDQQAAVMFAIQSDSNQQLAAEKFSGESHLTGVQALMNTGMIRLHTLTEKIRPNLNSRFVEGGLADNQEVTARAQFDPHAEFERTSVWYAGYGMGGHIAGDENTSSTGVTFSGLMVGIEGTYGCGSKKIGFFYDRSNVATDVEQLTSKGSIDTNYFGGYHTSELENGYRLFSLGFGEDRYRSRRILNAGSGDDLLSEVAQSGYHGWQTSFYSERGFDLQGSWRRLQPYLGFQYSYIRRNAFEETGAELAGLNMNAVSYDSFRSYLGTRWSLPFIEIGHEIKTGQPVGGFFQFQTAWIHEMLDKTAPICNAQLGASTLSNSFVVEGANCGRDWWLGSVGTNWRLTRSFSFYGDYTILLNARQTSHTGSGGLCLSW